MKPLTPVKVRYPTLANSVRKFCLTRCEDGAKRVKLCEDTLCPLHPYRFAKNPNRAGISGGKRPGMPKNRHSIEAVHAENKKLGVMEGSGNLSNPGASGGEIDHGQINLETNGKISIKRLNNNELVITLKSEC